MLRLEQKLVKEKIELMFKFFMDGELEQNTYTGTLATAKSGLELPEYNMFEGYEKDSPHLLNRLPSLVEIRGRQVLAPPFDFFESQEAVEACKVYVA